METGILVATVTGVLKMLRVVEKGPPRQSPEPVGIVQCACGGTWRTAGGGRWQPFQVMERISKLAGMEGDVIFD